MALSAETIGKVAWNAGFGRDEPTLARAIAVALAESSGNPNAHNTNAKTGDNSYGLWQINMLGSMGPARRKQFGIASNDELFDPQKNANAAWKISGGGRNWTPWSMFKNGTYTKHMPTATAAAKSVIAGAGAAGFLYNIPGGQAARDAGQTVGGALQDGAGITGMISNAVNALTGSLFKAGINTAAVMLAVVLFVLGVAILMRGPIMRAKKGVVKVATNVGTTVGPQGKVAKAAAAVVSAKESASKAQAKAAKESAPKPVKAAKESAPKAPAKAAEGDAS